MPAWLVRTGRRGEQGQAALGHGLVTTGKVADAESTSNPPKRGIAMLRGRSFISVKEAVELLGVCPNTVRARGAAGRIPEYRHPGNDYRLFKVSDLDKLLRKTEQSATRTIRKPQ